MSDASVEPKAEDAIELPAVAPAVELARGSAGDAAAAALLPDPPPPPPPLLDEEREPPASRLLLLPPELDAAGSFPATASLRESVSVERRERGSKHFSSSCWGQQKATTH